MLILFTFFLGTISSSFAARSIDLEAISKKLGLELLSQGKPWTFPGVHKVYANEDLSRSMLVIENIPGKVASEILEDKNFTVLMFPISNKKYISVAFVNISANEVSDLNIKKTSYFKTIINNLSPLGNAFAGDADDPGCSIEQSDYRPLNDSSINQVADDLSNNVWNLGKKCFMGVMQGVYDSTVGLGASLWKGVKSLAGDPKGFWKERVEQYNKMKTFFSTFKESMRSAAAGIAKLPAQAKTELICSFISSIGVDVLAGVFLGGVTLALVVPKITAFVAKISKLSGFLTGLSTLNKLPQLPDGFFNRLLKMRGPAADKVLDRIQSFSLNGLDDMALTFASCAI